MNTATPLLAPSVALTRGFVLPEAQAALQALPARSAAGGEPRQGFRIGPLNLMIRYELGSELADVPTLHRMPNAPEWFLGMTNLHGALLPVFDLAGYIGVERPHGARTLLLVLAHGADAAGVLIDGLPERLRVAPAHWLADPVVPQALEGCIAGACLQGERAWLDLDTTALLARLEQALAA
jgi:chemotaxis signal transduction protein